jgi:DNA-binding transcriptional MerR regulator
MNRKVLTVGGIARAAGVSEWTVRLYAKQNLIPFSLDSAGRRLFDEAVVPTVRTLYTKRVGTRGRGSRA